MRIIPPATRELLNNPYGLEPVTIFAIQWVKDGAYYYYADKDITEGDVTIPGSILEVGVLESVVKVDSKGHSQSINIKLSDTDSIIKELFNNYDLQGRPAKIYQWFDSLPLSEKFVIFEGEINSDIVWSEGDRTIEISVITKVNLTEVGFSPEEGEFEYIPDGLVGKAWPLVFGTVKNVPCVNLSTVPKGQLGTAHGLVDPTLQAKISENASKAKIAHDLGAYYIAQGLTAGGIAMSLKFDIKNSTNTDYTQKLINQWQAAVNYQESCRQNASTALTQEITINNATQELLKSKRTQDAYYYDNMELINGSLYPQNKEISLDIGDVTYVGTLNGSTFTINKTTLHNFTNDMTQTFGMTYQQVGKTVVLTSYLRTVYIVNILPSTIINVKAFYGSAGARIMTYIPTSWYTTQIVNIGGYTVTAIIFEKPPSAYDEKFENDVYVTLTSTIGPNVISIIRWLITTYTDLEIDETSFTYVDSKLTNYPANFALLSRQDVLKTVEDIAFQSRCATWISDNKVHIRYLAETPTPVSTITEDDIDAGTMQIVTTSSEDLVTKMIATWVDDYSLPSKNKTVIRYNVSKYGLYEREIDFYIYSDFNLVYKSATFWMIRFANIWKKLKFTTYLDKLEIETFDTITLDFNTNYVSDTDVPTEVISLSYDSSERLITVETQTPVRAGTMVPYEFFYPADLDATILFPGPFDLVQNYPGGTLPGKDTSDTNLEPSGIGVNTSLYDIMPKRRDYGKRHISDKYDTSPPVAPGARDPIAGVDPGYTGGNIYPIYTTSTVSPKANTVLAKALAVYYGKIISGSGETYKVNVFVNGQSVTPKEKTVTRIGDTADDLEPDSWVECSLIYKFDIDEDDKLVEIEVWTMLVIVGGSGASTYPGQIQSGSDDSYTVNVYIDGINETPTSKTVKQLQIDSSETIPTGTWAMCSLNNVTINGEPEEEWTMQVAVWL